MLFVLLSCTIAVVLTSCSTTNRLEGLRNEYKHDVVDVAKYMEDRKIPSYGSTLPKYYNTGAEWNVRSLELIEKATDYILVSTFLGVEHESTAPVWQALAKKAAEGVRVYIMIDSSSNFQMIPISNERIKAAFMYLRDLGLDVVEYNSLSMSNLFFLPNLLDRDHRKYWVFDGELLAVGGINVNQTSIDWPSGMGNIDTMAEIISPGATGAVVETFVDTWNRYSPQRLSTNDFTVNNDLPTGESNTALWFLDHNWPSKASISSLFDLFSMYAEDELWLVQGYTFLTPALLDRLRYAVERGVSVNVILSENSTQPKYEMASRYGVLDLLDIGVNVWMFESPMKAFLHLKLMIADDTLVTVGSANYNLRSQTLSREMNILFEDDRVAEYSLAYVDTLLEHCRPVTREEALSYRNFRSWFNYVLMQVWG
jgi:cardiolipin synthase